ncbi:hypothetical protein ABRY23_03480 [Melioribacteraceae bacterium 4301-Me]|uniref:hypothetical protein n=1 Tax=Pyranulibacter aquaticus TaxID=3163344 RepID=UPI00359BA72A
MRTIDEVLENKIDGLYYGNRVLLPFTAEILKAIIEDEIIMEFNTPKASANYSVKEDYTEIYFHAYKNLKEVVTKYEAIKLVVVEKGKDLFNINNHKKLALHLKENHKLTIEEIDDNILFIE